MIGSRAKLRCKQVHVLNDLIDGSRCEASARKKLTIEEMQPFDSVECSAMIGIDQRSRIVNERSRMVNDWIVSCQRMNGSRLAR